MWALQHGPAVAQADLLRFLCLECVERVGRVSGSHGRVRTGPLALLQNGGVGMVSSQHLQVERGLRHDQLRQ